MTSTVFDILTLVSMLVGMFFMFIGAVGLWRLPDFFTRAHAASKCITLGISGLLMAVVFHVSAGTGADPGEGANAVREISSSEVLGAVTKALLVIVFQFVAAPVGTHMLAKAAHLDGIGIWEETLSDELTDDVAEAPRQGS